ncbi:YheT family hydrolase [Aestuariirhabdus litorea]|uniref:Alpha/beta fold hydrolase n=1 Tax=Aestuariirhabdus litorea TaxID=2528527 RepID=A0A3P3VQK6_9GAMM|nr:alpha/beta fold hydrolase [Aestuariirhabdus litorea]RRJ83936.1 alpha/beta fold hydrolase [Aestuariirhabdus litorea]RWW97158.1 alpha/beta fold hydrolase [Endozoicomonadaceae bacterium GTF-13]
MPSPISELAPFTPSRPFTNGHVQTLMASLPLRRPLERHRARALLASSQAMIFNCGDGVRLHGEYSPQPVPSGELVVLIHGWEGCSDSLYLLSAASYLYRQGFDVLRLHLRDHGPSHHLNRELFNSSRDAEVAGAMHDIHSCLRPERLMLAGFSLGGNFALRVGLRAEEYDIPLERVAAVCPVISPPSTMDSLEQGWSLYHNYFVRKWKRSLATKLEHFPELGYRDALLKMRSLREMTDYFVIHHTDFEDTERYLESYAITGQRLAGLKRPALLLAAEDDPVILAENLDQLADNPLLEVRLTRHGGHCGYIKNWSLHSWANEALHAFLTRPLAGAV